MFANEDCFYLLILVALIMFYLAMVLPFLLRAHTELLSSAMQWVSHALALPFHTSQFQCHFEVWNVSQLFAICGCQKTKIKASLYHWKRSCKSRKYLESDGNFCPINIQNFIKNQFTFYQNLIMFYRCMGAYNYFAHHIQVLQS